MIMLKLLRGIFLLIVVLPVLAVANTWSAWVEYNNLRVGRAFGLTIEESRFIGRVPTGYGWLEASLDLRRNSCEDAKCPHYIGPSILIGVHPNEESNRSVPKRLPTRLWVYYDISMSRGVGFLVFANDFLPHVLWLEQND
jgi:hypothetical protein